MTLPITLLIAHFIGDFLLQSNKMALNKSKWDQSGEGVLALLSHALLYSLLFFMWGFWFWVSVLFLHILVDAITSKMTSALWFVEVKRGKLAFNESKRHWFFCVLGFDQLLHAICLALSWMWLAGV